MKTIVAAAHTIVGSRKYPAESELIQKAASLAHSYFGLTITSVLAPFVSSPYNHVVDRCVQGFCFRNRLKHEGIEKRLPIYEIEKKQIYRHGKGISVSITCKRRGNDPNAVTIGGLQFLPKNDVVGYEERNLALVTKGEALLCLWDGRTPGCKHLISLALDYGLKTVVLISDETLHLRPAHLCLTDVPNALDYFLSRNVSECPDGMPVFAEIPVWRPCVPWLPLNRPRNRRPS